MSQIYVNMHKISELSTRDTFMYRVFSKQKMILIYQYEDGQLHFIIGVLPEYQKIIEGAISSQFANCSIEMTTRPKMFSKKYSDITIMQPKKDPIYTIRMFKLMPDDPINNIIDALSKISRYDTATIMIPIKPEDSRFNKKMQKAADRLFKNLELYSRKDSRRAKLLMPRKLF